MSLLEDLRGIDLSEIVDARASIRAAVEGPELQELITAGAPQAALGVLGTSLQELRESFDDPASLLRPLVEAVGQLGGPLSTDGLPISRYANAVRDGATLVADLLGDLRGDPARFGSSLGLSLGDALKSARSVVGSYTQLSLDGLTQLRRLVDTIERGLPDDPEEIALLAAELLLPFSGSRLRVMRSGLSEVSDGVVTVTVPARRTVGLTVALDAVVVAAGTGDAGRLDAALAELARVRENTLTALSGDLIQFVTRIQQLRLDEVLAPVAEAAEALRVPGEGVLEFLERWRVLLAGARARVEELDPAQVAGIISQILDIVEQTARAEILEPLEARIRELQDWLRGLFRQLGLRSLRSQLTAFFHAAAAAIRDADLDRPAREVREFLERIRSTLESADLEDEIRGAVEAAEREITDALDEIVTALETIGNRINAVTSQAQSILEQAATALADFRSAMDGVTAAIDQLGIQDAADEVIESIRELRETAEKLLSLAPLPEPLRPLIEQLIDTLEAIDFDVVFQPIREAAAEFEIPDEIGSTVRESLQATQDLLANLIPTELISSIEAEVSSALDTLRSFDPSTLLSGVGDFLTEAADFIEGLDPRPVVAEIRAPFQAVVDALDQVHPRRLLAPAIEAYDSLLGSIPVPAPDTAMQATVDALASASDGMARAAAEPIGRMAPEGAVEVEETEGAAPTPTLPLPESFRPGDVVRMLGYLPNRLREYLSAADAGLAGDVLRAIDSICGGLARDLRSLEGRLQALETQLTAGIDELLAPLGEAQLRAQISIQANFSADSYDVDGALVAVAQVGPGSLRATLAKEIGAAREKTRGAVIGASTRVGSSLETAALALERCRLSTLGGDLDAFLAALDPEPIAAELDGLVAALFDKTPELLAELEDEIRSAVDRFKALLEELNPGNQIQKFTKVLDVLREQIDLLNPRRLADELGEIHGAIRAIVTAYDPAVFANEIHAGLQAVAEQLRSLDPSALLGDLSFFDDLLTRIETAVPTHALSGVGESLGDVGAQLGEIDPSRLLEAVEDLGPELIDEVERTAEALRREIVALLESLRYASVSASVRVEAEVA